MRPTRAAAENTPAKPGRQPSFSQSATVPLEREPSLTSAKEVPRRLMKSNSASNITKSNMAPNIKRSNSAPKKKLSGGALFLAEMVRRRVVSETG